MNHIPDLFTHQPFFAWTTGPLYLSSDVDIFEKIDWSTYHVFFQRRFADGYVRIDRGLPRRIQTTTTLDVNQNSY